MSGPWNKAGLLLVFYSLFYTPNACAADTTLTFYHKSFKSTVVIKYPKQKPKGTILLLHGYNLPAMQWCEKTTLCTKALEQGYVLIIPDFGKSTYQEKFYPETNTNFRVYPTRKWMRDTVIAQLQEKLNLLKPGQNNFVLGLSTGARGAALLSVDLPKVFKAAACLSGDYDQTKLPFEKIYHNYYGEFKTWKNRWANDDNLHTLIQQWQTPVYLAHGSLDNVCPASQTTNFYNLLKKTKPQVKCQYVLAKDFKHDYTFWGSQTVGVLKFFEQFL